MATPSLKALEVSISGILGTAWEVFREHFGVILGITLIIYVPINIIIEYIPLELTGDTATDLGAFADYSRILQLLETFIGVIALMSIAVITEKALSKKKEMIELKPVLHQALSRWPSSIGTNLLLGLALVVLFLALIVPGIIYTVYWQFAIIAVALREKFGRAAMSFSKDLVYGRWWKVLGISLVLGILSILVLVPSIFVSFYLPDEILTNVVYSTVLDVILSFFTVAFAVFFLSLEQNAVEGRKSEVRSQKSEA